MDKSEREAIRARCEAATLGPWVIDDIGMHISQKEHMADGYLIADMRGWGYMKKILNLTDEEAIAAQKANGEFIAAARQDIPALLDALDELEKDYDYTSQVLESEMTNANVFAADVTRYQKLWQFEKDRADNAEAGEAAIKLFSLTDLAAVKADRDRWKAHADALERAIKLCEYDPACVSCIHHIEDGCAPENCDGRTRSGWEFDEARFAREAENE